MRYRTLTTSEPHHNGPYRRHCLCTLVVALFGGHAQAQILAPILYGLGNNSTGDSLSYSLSHNTTNITTNLTTVTTPGTDWYVLGGYSGNYACPGVERKSSGGSVIGGYTLVGGATLNSSSYFYSPNGMDWTDGTPNGSSSEAGGSGGGCETSTAVGEGLSITCPASTASHTCIAYIDGQNGSIFTVNAHLSDDSGHVHDINDTETVGSTTQWYAYTFTYAAASSAQTLAVTITYATGYSGSWFFQAAAYE